VATAAALAKLEYLISHGNMDFDSTLMPRQSNDDSTLFGFP
jgi:hypothetical protein